MLTRMNGDTLGDTLRNMEPGVLDAKLKKFINTRAPNKMVPYYLEDRWPNVVIRESHGHPFKIKL